MWTHEYLPPLPILFKNCHIWPRVPIPKLGRGASLPMAANAACSVATTCAPSPTAAATRPRFPGIAYHGWPAAVTPATGMSHKGQLVGAKALAASIIDLLTSPELLAKARAEFEVKSKHTPYFSLLPPDARPDLELNRVEMERYRADMRKFYLNKTPRFN